MKELTLIRHAAAGWGEIGRSDIDRELTAHGESAAREMAARLAAAGLAAQLLISSTAARAEATAAPLATGLGLGERWQREPRIYEASVGELLGLCQELDDDLDRVLLVGHNPGFSDLARVLSREAPRGLPPAGAVRMHFEIARWAELGRGLAHHTECFFPGEGP